MCIDSQHWLWQGGGSNTIFCSHLSFLHRHVLSRISIWNIKGWSPANRSRIANQNGVGDWGPSHGQSEWISIAFCNLQFFCLQFATSFANSQRQIGPNCVCAVQSCGVWWIFHLLKVTRHYQLHVPLHFDRWTNISHSSHITHPSPTRYELNAVILSSMSGATRLASLFSWISMAGAALLKVTYLMDTILSRCTFWSPLM